MGYVDEATYELQKYEEEYGEVWHYLLSQNPGVPQEHIQKTITTIMQWYGDEEYTQLMKEIFKVDTTVCDDVHRILTYSYEEWCENFWETLND